MKKTIPALPVQDIKQSMEFYTTKLGFTVRHHDEGFCIVVRDQVEIRLWKSGDETWKTKGAALAADPVCSGAESFLAGMFPVGCIDYLLTSLPYILVGQLR